MIRLSTRARCQTLLAAILLLHAPLSLAAVEHPAMARLQEVVGQMKQRVTELQSEQDGSYDSMQLDSMVADIVTPNFDFEVISRLVLGRNWKQISDAQRSEFAEQFRLFLIRTYSRSLLKSPEVEIDYLNVEVSEKREDLALVKTRMTMRDGNAFLVDYRMLGKQGAWKVVDILVDGVSLLSTYRGSFGTEIEKNGMDSLLARLRERNTDSSEAGGI